MDACYKGQKAKFELAGLTELPPLHALPSPSACLHAEASEKGRASTLSDSMQSAGTAEIPQPEPEDTFEMILSNLPYLDE